jgi:outer membrane immunogenic protein
MRNDGTWNFCPDQYLCNGDFLSLMLRDRHRLALQIRGTNQAGIHRHWGVLMKKFLLATAALGALAMPAMAADMAPAPIYKAPVPVAVCMWCGFYIGGNVGGSIGHDATSESASLLPPGGTAGVTNPLASTSHTLSPTGALGGVQLGWNRQIGSVVWGVEGDWAWTSQQDKLQEQNFFASSVVVAPSVLNYSDEQKISWLSTVRGRVGLTHDSFLWYVTGGAAFAEVQSNQTFGVSQIVGAGVFGPAAGAASFTATKTGWTLGGGVETSLAWLGMANNWSTKLEYLYVDLGSVTNTFSAPGALAGTNYVVSSSSHIHDNIIRFGVNYRFW